MIVESHEMLCLLFIESTDYEDRMLYLQGLSNLELKQSLDYLAPIIVGQPPSDHHIQFLATWAVLNTAHANPNKVLCYNNTGTRLVNTRCVILHQQLIQGLAKEMDGKEGCILFYLYKLGDTSVCFVSQPYLGLQPPSSSHQQLLFGHICSRNLQSSASEIDVFLFVFLSHIHKKAP